VAAVSSLWRTRAVGPAQADYLNAAALIEWPGPPRELLDHCLELEGAAGRDRSGGDRWGPRTLDLDLLLARGVVCRGPTLELPHPRLHLRRFALEPAAEVAGSWVVPTIGRTVEELAERSREAEPDAIVGVDPFEGRSGRS
jgi:2-amino-4-hydroxy-6-hydroxymethyldihydropteridine diphosphokinase